MNFDQINISFFKRQSSLVLIVVMFLLCLRPSKSSAQVTSEEIKASLIVHFCENVAWPTKVSDQFVIGCYTKDDAVYGVLRKAVSIVKIQNRQITVRRINSFREASRCHAVFYNQLDQDELINNLKMIRENNVLLITDNYPDQLFVMINIVDEAENVGFKVNMSNLTLANLTVKPNILLNGGSVVDIKKAYEEFENRLRVNRRSYEKTLQKLNENEKLLQQKDAVIKKREAEVMLYKAEIDSIEQALVLLNQQVVLEQAKLDERTTELSEKDSQLQHIYVDIEQKKGELDNLRLNIENLKTEADTLKTEIGQKNIVLTKQQESLINQRRYLYLLLGLAAALLLAAFSLTRLFLTKKKLNKELEEKVRQRTRELQIKSDQYLSLFNLAPVPIWEMDFSDVKRWIDDHQFKDGEAYDRYVNQHPEFGIECFRKIKFININSASLHLLQLSSTDEIYELYEELFVEGFLAGIGHDFKTLYLNKKIHDYEAVRFDKYHNRLDVLITWLDVSQEPATYSRVLLTMVNVTHLRKIESELRIHQENLEELVKERTDEIGTLNEELRVQNEQLYDTNGALEKANNELVLMNEALNEQKIKLNEALGELKQAQMQIVQSEKMASLGVLTSGIAHEINNPLNFIQAGVYALETIIEEASLKYELSQEIQTLIQNMHIGVQRTSAIVKSLNAFSRKDSHRISVCNIHEIIDNTLLILNHEIKGTCQVHKEYTQEHFELQGNDETLHQVFLNVIMNAVQAMSSKGQLTIKTRLKDAKWIEIKVSDSGRGMKKEVMDKIYDPFFTTKEPGKGVGMGLSIVYKIIHDHNGSIQYFSELNKGTDVIILLPVSIS